MKKALFLFVLVLLSASCKQEINQQDINKINGYWEIERVKLIDGSTKEYSVNQTIDYFELKDKKGFRQKVMPQFNGTYTTNGIKESIYVYNENNNFFIEYVSNYGKWVEEIVEVKDSTLVLKNKNETFFYKRPIPFSLK